MKRFKKKKKFKIKKVFKLAFYLFIVYFAYQLTTYTFLSLQLKTNNEDFLKMLMNDTNHLMLYEKTSKNLIGKITKWVAKLDINNPVSILENNFHIKSNNEEFVYKDDYIPEQNTSHIKDPSENLPKEPRVYLYSTHQLENYSATNLEAYNITPNVMMASYILKENLNKASIPTIVEEADITEFIHANGWNYNSSYKASRYYIEEALKKNNNYELIIDVHRDAIKKNAATITIDNKNYAKILFVVGLEHSNYKPNLELAKKFNSLVASKYPGLSRGVITKSGSGVDGIYNQDLSPKMLLLEVGGYENTIDEVKNTMDAVSKIIEEYFNEKE